MWFVLFHSWLLLIMTQFDRCHSKKNLVQSQSRVDSWTKVPFKHKVAKSITSNCLQPQLVEKKTIEAFLGCIFIFLVDTCTCIWHGWVQLGCTQSKLVLHSWIIVNPDTCIYLELFPFSELRYRVAVILQGELVDGWHKWTWSS